MKPNEFLRAIAASMPGTPSASRTSALVQFAPRLADFRPDALTGDLAEAVGRGLTQFPTADDLVDRIRAAMPAHGNGGPRRAMTEEDRIIRCWDRYAGMRLSEGANPRLLLSLVRAYCPAAGLEEVLTRHFPGELERQRRERAEITRDRAAVARQLAAVQGAVRPEPAPRVPVVTTRPAVGQAPRPREDRAHAHLAQLRALAGVETRGEG